MKMRAIGFTLIEMLLVVAILVALAGFVLPKLDRINLKTNKGVSAGNMSGLSRYVQTYRIQHNVYPDRWDSMTDGTALPTPGQPGTTAGLDPQLVGGPPTGSPHKLIIDTIHEQDASGGTGADHTVRSLTRMGIVNVLDWSTVSTALPGNRFVTLRSLADGAKIATINKADGDGAAIIDRIYPQNKLSGGVSGSIPAGNHLVVLGFGPLNTAVGDVLQETWSNARKPCVRPLSRPL